MIADSVAFLRAPGRQVVYDAEHFFDGFAHDPEYALADAAGGRRRPAPTRSSCATPTAAACPSASPRRSPPCGGRPASRSASTRTTTPSCAVANALAAVGRRDAGAGDDQRRRRALRQHGPHPAHRQPAAEDGLDCFAGDSSRT